MPKLHHRHHRNLPGAFEGRSSRVYDLVSRRFLRRLYRRLATEIAATAPHGATVLDVGTGPGTLLVELAKRRPDLRLTGVDLSADMIAAANRNLAPVGDRASARVGDVTDLPFPDQSFDLIVSSLSLHHWDHPEAAAPQLARVLRPGGRVQVYDATFAPFTALTNAARDLGVLHAQPPTRTRVASGVPFLRWVRLTMTG